MFILDYLCCRPTSNDPILYDKEFNGSFEKDGQTHTLSGKINFNDTSKYGTRDDIMVEKNRFECMKADDRPFYVEQIFRLKLNDKELDVRYFIEDFSYRRLFVPQKVRCIHLAK